VYLKILSFLLSGNYLHSEINSIQSQLIKSTSSSTLLSSKQSMLNTLKNTIARTASRTMATATTTANGLTVTTRPWNARGHADHGWLYTFHSFNFASYWDPKHMGLGPLRVINEDRVEKGTGFGTHAHAEFLIWSYIVSGELEHKDSMGNLEILKRGEVQFTSAGTGIRHSEYNRNKKTDNHFLQIWAKPDVAGLTPSYITRNYPDSMKQDKLVRIIESTARHSGAEGQTDPIPAHTDLSMDASILSPGKKVVHEIVAEGDRKLYAHVVMTGKDQPEEGGARIKIGDTVLGEGDGAYIEGAKGSLEIESVGDKPAEFLLFDVGK
jgi:redox-sensitive bicupin YhaK (pirin superfamily)